eukprot:749187-Hanusia_phi.AAC.2
MSPMHIRKSCAFDEWRGKKMGRDEEGWTYEGVKEDRDSLRERDRDTLGEREEEKERSRGGDSRRFQVMRRREGGGRSGEEEAEAEDRLWREGGRGRGGRWSRGSRKSGRGGSYDLSRNISIADCEIFFASRPKERDKN